MNFQMFKLNLEKAEEPEIKLPTSAGSSKKQESSRKTSTSVLFTMTLTVWITTNYGILLKRWDYQTILPSSWETYIQVKKQQLEPDMEEQTGSKLRKEYVKPIYCHPAYLTHMQSTSWETLGSRKHKLESRLQRENQQPQTCRLHDLNGRKWRETIGPLDKSERGEWKNWLKTQHSKTKIMASVPMANRWGNSGNSIFLGSKITADGDCSHGCKAVKNLDSLLKSRDITLLTNVHLVKLWFFQSCMDVWVGP